MALTKNQDVPKFESPDEDQAAAKTPTANERLAAAAAKHTAEQPKEEESKPASTSTAVAVSKGNQIAAAKPMINPLEPLKNSFPLQFDTLRGLKVTNGNVVDISSGKSLGDTVGMELLTYQDQWVISPGVDGDEGKEFVRYSDDGVTTSKGENCKDYLDQLIDSDYPEAKMSKRTVIAGSLFDIGVKGRKECKDMQDALVQISLAPTSKAGFDRYLMDQAFQIRKGRLSAEGADRIRIECTPVSKGDKDWTVANFSRYEEVAE